MTLVHEYFLVQRDAYGRYERPRQLMIFDSWDQQILLSEEDLLHVLRVEVGSVVVLVLMLHVRCVVRGGCRGIH